MKQLAALALSAARSDQTRAALRCVLGCILRALAERPQATVAPGHFPRRTEIGQRSETASVEPGA